MGRSRYNLGHRVPPRIQNPPNKAANPEWWKDEKNLMRLDPSYQEGRYIRQRRKHEKKQKSRPK